MSENRYFNSIDDIILSNWFKCMDGDYSYTRIDLKNGNKKEDWNAWCIIHDSYLDEFGSSQQEKEIFDKSVRTVKLMVNVQRRFRH